MILQFQVIDPKGNELDNYSIDCVNKFDFIKTYYGDETVFNYKDFNFRLKPEIIELLHKVLHNKQYPELAKKNLIELKSNLDVVVEVKDIILNKMTHLGQKLIKDSYSIPKYLSFMSKETVFTRHFLELFLTTELTLDICFSHTTSDNHIYNLSIKFFENEFSEFEKLW